MGQTENYGLKQWESWEVPGREAINAAVAAVDEALREKSEAVFGAYTGDGEEEQLIALGFAPKAVLVTYLGGFRENYGGLALEGHPYNFSSQQPLLALEATGFRVCQRRISSNSANLNNENSVYHYMVFW